MTRTTKAAHRTVKGRSPARMPVQSRPNPERKAPRPCLMDGLSAILAARNGLRAQEAGRWHGGTS